MISAIVAVDNNWGIGFNGELLEHIPEDLKYFKELTTGHVVVMGTNTWNSLPIKPLPKRGNIIISSADRLIMCKNTLRLHMEDVIDYFDYTDDDVFIIGGGSIYKQLLPFCDRVYVTKIFKDHENVDTYFPNLDESEEWAPAMCGNLRTHNDLSYQFWQYDRIS
jgi:dihydrofolate reductase